MKISGVKLGQTANVLHGFKPVWDVTDAAGLPLYVPPVETMVPFSLELDVEKPAVFSFPRITLHHDLDSLANALLPLRILPFRGDPGPFSVPAGTLMLHHHRDWAMRHLSQQLGIDLRRDYRYLLVQLERPAGERYHEIVDMLNPAIFGRKNHLTKAGRQAMARLRPGERRHDGARHDAVISGEQAKDYVAFFYQCGTHFVSKVEAGDRIYQLFAYEPAQFAAVARALGTGKTPASGYTTLGLHTYTGPDFVAAVGNIVCHSQDPLVAASVARGDWFDDQVAHANTIFSPFMRHPDPQHTFLAQFQQIVPTALELLSINHFIEYFRSASWQRLFKGAMLQLYGDKVRFPIPKFRSVDWAQLFPVAADLSALGCVQSSYADRLDLAALPVVTDDPIRSFTCFCPVLQVRDAVVRTMPGRQVALTAHIIDGADDSAALPTLRLDHRALACGEMHGGIWLENEAGTERRLLIDGFVLQTAVSDPRSPATVEVVGDVWATPAGLLANSLPAIQQSLTTVEVLLHRQGKQHHKAAVDYLAWLLKMLPASSERPTVRTLRLLVLCLHLAASRPGGLSAVMGEAMQQEELLALASPQLAHVWRLRMQWTEQAKTLATLLQRFITDGFEIQQRLLIALGQHEWPESSGQLAAMEQQLAAAREEVKTAVCHYRRTLLTPPDHVQLALDAATQLFAPQPSLTTPANLPPQLFPVWDVLAHCMEIERVVTSLANGVNAENLPEVEQALSATTLAEPTAEAWNALGEGFAWAWGETPASAAAQQAKAVLLAAEAQLVAVGSEWLTAQIGQALRCLGMFYQAERLAFWQRQTARLAQLSAAEATTLPELLNAFAWQQQQLRLALLHVWQQQAARYEAIGQRPLALETDDLTMLLELIHVQAGQLGSYESGVAAFA